MTNSEISKLFKQIAAAYTIKGENTFRILAYEKAAESVENLPGELHDLWKEGKMAIPGIGKTLATHLDELFKTGKVKHFESVLKEMPGGMFTLLDVPGFGPKKAYTLAKEFNLNDPNDAIEKLKKAALEGKIAPLPRFGEKSQTDILESLAQYKRGEIKENRMPLPYAHAIAKDVVAYLKLHKDILKIEVLGSLRRRVATIGDVDIAAATKNGEAVLDHFLSYPKKSSTIERGPTGASIMVTSGRQVDLRVLPPSQFGAMVQYFTGSKNHNVKLRELALKKGLSLNEYGIKHVDTKKPISEYDTEEKFYRALDLPWIPPELREDTGEIQLALQNKVPKIVELSDIKGDFHIHCNHDIESSHDMGSSSPKEIIEKASELGYSYIGISDHNPSSSKHTNYEIITILKRRKEIFENLMYSTKSTRVHLFTMMETDILPDGRLALPEDAFEYLDATIVSIHSSFQMSKNEMTKRVILGLSHPKAKILAHPTGRLLGKREGYELDWNTIFAFCKEFDKALEINSFPERLDISDVVVREAIKNGVKLVIDTDAHDKSHMDLMEYGVSVARRGWAQKKDILNTMGYNDVKSWLVKNSKKE